MAIRSSSASEIDRLLADLISGSPARREAAVARLTVIGTRAVERVLRLAEDPAAPANDRAAAFRALEAIADPRAMEPALRAVFDPEESVALAAIGVARAFLTTPRGVAVVDRLTEIAADRTGAVRRRLAALDALRGLEPATLEPLVAALKSDPSAEVAAVAQGHTATESEAAAACVTEGAAGRWPADGGEALRRALGQIPARFSLSTLHRLVNRLREHEGRLPPAARAEWTAARAAAHVALARRGSRLALYDLREALESADSALPVEFLTALSAIGDASCLEAIASAYARSGGSARDWWHRHLVDAFHRIVARHRLTKRHPAARKVRARWPDLLDLLWP